jgi:hypothetical protein
VDNKLASVQKTGEPQDERIVELSLSDPLEREQNRSASFRESPQIEHAGVVPERLNELRCPQRDERAWFTGAHPSGDLLEVDLAYSVHLYQQ